MGASKKKKNDQYEYKEFLLKNMNSINENIVFTQNINIIKTPICSLKILGHHRKPPFLTSD